MTNPSPNSPNFQRELSLDLTVSFGPGSKIHGKRLTAIKKAVDDALAEAVIDQVGDVDATITSTLKWVYSFREETSTVMLVDPEADDTEL